MAQQGEEGRTEQSRGGQPVSAVGEVDPLVGRVIDDRYRVEYRLGEGGMGVVYRVSHTTLGKAFAMKVLRPEVSKSEEILARFKQEAQSASAIGNQHIIDITDFGTLEDGAAYFVMEFLTGRTLSSVIAARELTERRTIHIIKQLCRALGAAHDRGIVHRDMKPDNVQLIERGGDADFVKVLDFGIAKVGGGASKLTQAGQIFGTPHYMSPEQCSGAAVDLRTDIYAVGIILYEMTTGEVPFDADNLMGVLTKHLYEAPLPPLERTPPADISPGLEAVLLRCLEKQPERRYQTCAELLVELEAIEQGHPPQASHDRVLQYESGARPVTAQSVPRVTLDAGEARIPRRSAMPIVLGLLGIGAVAVAGIYVMGAGDDGADGDSGAEPAAPVAAQENLPAEQENPAPSELAESGPAEAALPSPHEVLLVSVPSGAEIYRAAERLGVTPYSAVRPVEGAMVLTLKRDGYQDESITLEAEGPDRVSVSLTEVPTAKKKASTTKKSAAATGKTSSSSSKAPSDGSNTPAATPPSGSSTTTASSTQASGAKEDTSASQPSRTVPRTPVQGPLQRTKVLDSSW